MIILGILQFCVKDVSALCKVRFFFQGHEEKACRNTEKCLKNAFITTLNYFC